MKKIINWLNKPTKTETIKNWHVIVGTGVFIFALIGESVINNLIK
jgi:hypothetical protein